MRDGSEATVGRPRWRAPQALLRADGLKYCTSCRRVMSLALFGKNSARNDGLTVYCAECSKSLAKARQQRPEVKRANAKRAIEAWHARSPAEKEATAKRRAKNWDYLYKYNITPDEYDLILRAQGGGCAICGKSAEQNGSRLAIDHDHACCPGVGSCGKCIRGLLCTACNVRLGHIENYVWMEAAESYLMNYEISPTLASADKSDTVSTD